MPVLIKICGLKNETALEAALEGGADFVGFVFFAPSPRHLDFTTAHTLAARVAGRAGKVALTVDADDAMLAQIVEVIKPDLLQLHGSETPSRVTDIKTRFKRPVMKALPVAEAADLAAIADYSAVADRLLFDARPPADATRPGGLGRVFDWRLLENLDPGIPFMLSGGLDPDNVATALGVTQAPAVDVSSGVERASGEKDPDKIRAFIRAVRQTDGATKTKLASTA
ncbi:MAG TPA: phosphoribosylanthranilate isomerase [Xanthobacteraceae bacterium]|jgi:phosphoribosylanthranilate isomerase|nr:phosphoribosylanthranilate isomerase [Xanthobacteraceae bacterium]